MIVYGTLLVCALLVGVLVYRYDLYEKEPVPMLLLAAGLGALGMWLVGPVEDWSLGLYGRGPAPAALFAAVASTHEEAMKALVVFLMSLVFAREFEDPMDGLIYGSIVGLGAAVYESVFYLGFAYAQADSLPGGEVVRVCAHPVMGGMAGFGVGLARLRVGRWRGLSVVAAGVSVGIHFLWDWLSLTAVQSGVVRAWHSYAAAGLMLVGFVVYGCLVRIGVGLSREVMAPESTATLWGWPFRRAE